MSAPRSNFLAAAPLDRIGHLRRDEAWLAAARGRGDWIAVWRRKVLVSAEASPRPLFLAADAVADEPQEWVLLGERAGVPCFAFALAGEEPPETLGRFEDIRGIGEQLEPGDAALLAYARAMLAWHEHHRHCSRCGAPTHSIEAGHARKCSGCGAKHFPRVDPAIIVLVADGDRCLLGRQPAWPPGRYSTIAGFVEPGESLEDAVAREVAEETGVRVSGIEYHSSQPWPFPSSLMLGFIAHATSERIVLRDSELEDARWLTRDDIAAGEVLPPPRVSIAWRLIEHWFDAVPGRSLSREVQAGPWVARPES